VADVYIRADGASLGDLAEALAAGQLSLRVGAVYPLEEAAAALETAVAGGGSGATVLAIQQVP
jgi:NADPH:quinone reductase-like Zn-dependent oxidoreductase